MVCQPEVVDTNLEESVPFDDEPTLKTDEVTMTNKEPSDKDDAVLPRLDEGLGVGDEAAALDDEPTPEGPGTSQELPTEEGFAPVTDIVQMRI